METKFTEYIIRIETKGIIMSIVILPIFMVFRYLLGYRTILYIDLAYFIFAALYLGIIFFKKSTTKIISKVFLNVYLLYMVVGAIFLPSFESKSSFVDLIAALTYIIPAILFLIYYMYKKNLYKKAIEK